MMYAINVASIIGAKSAYPPVSSLPIIIDEIGVFAVAPKNETIATIITDETSIQVNSPIK